MGAPMNKPTKGQARVNHALNAMPYGAGINPRLEAENITLETAAVFLEALAERLTDVAERHQKDAETLKQYENDVAAIRRVFGVLR